MTIGGFARSMGCLWGHAAGPEYRDLALADLHWISIVRMVDILDADLSRIAHVDRTTVKHSGTSPVISAAFFAFSGVIGRSCIQADLQTQPAFSHSMFVLYIGTFLPMEI
mgnify:CR=1 FL=1